MSIQNHSGFAVVEALLVVIILGLIGGTGYYVWHSKRSVDTVKPANSSVSHKAAAAKLVPMANEDMQIKASVLNYNNGDSAGQNVAPEPNIAITIEHSNANFALGSVSASNGDSGGEWFAQKTNGIWLVVSQGADGHCDELALHGLTSWDATCQAN